MTIECKYTCRSCGLFRVPVNVEARTTEDVKVWMDTRAIPAASDDHMRRSPHCVSRTMAEFMIPLAGASKVGGPVEN